MACSTHCGLDYIKSHELKMPLTVLLLTADVIETLPECTENIKNHVTRIETEISRMTRLVQDLLLLSSIDAGNWGFHKSEINADTLPINIYDKFVNISNKSQLTCR